MLFISTKTLASLPSRRTRLEGAQLPLAEPSDGLTIILLWKGIPFKITMLLCMEMTRPPMQSHSS